jgi:hypothetical protein
MKLKVNEIIGSFSATEREKAALLLDKIDIALRTPRVEKVIVDFSDIKEVDAEFLAYGIIAIMDIYSLQDLTNNLGFENLTQYQYNLLEKIGQAWIKKRREYAEFVAWTSEPIF